MAMTRTIDTAKPAPRLSTAIAIARLVGILGVVYVHAWTGRTAEELTAQAMTAQGLLRIVVIEMFGRSAVPLLGMISGWLVVSTATRRGYLAFVTGKARAILLPMLLWSAIAVVAVCSFAWFGQLKAPVPSSLGWVLNELVPLAHPGDISVQMPFLRDLFVCMLVAPLLVRLPLSALAGIAVLVVVWSVSLLPLYVLLRPQILVFFIAGILARRTDAAERVATLPYGLAALPYALLFLPAFLFAVEGTPFITAHPHAMAAFDLVFRLASSLIFWRTAWAVAGLSIAGRIVRLERYGFLAFCDHLVLLWLLGPVIGLVTGPLGAPLYPAYLLLQPSLVLGATILLGKALIALAPAAAGILSGGRLTRPPDLPRPARPV